MPWSFRIDRDFLLPITIHDEKKVRNSSCRPRLLCLTLLVDLGIDNASEAKRPTSCEVEVWINKLYRLLYDFIFFRKELQYMLHNRRKAEIEVLLTSSESDATGGHNPRLDNCAPFTVSTVNCIPSNGRKCPDSHGLFLHYLTSKITYFVQSARNKNSQKEIKSYTSG